MKKFMRKTNLVSEKRGKNLYQNGFGGQFIAFNQDTFVGMIMFKYMRHHIVIFGLVCTHHFV